MHIANYLTYFRIAVIPLFIVMFYWDTPWTYFWTALIYSIAAITDWLDGYMARKLNQVSAFGAFLDPVADKLIVVVALILLIERHHHWLITVPGLIIIMREVTVSALRQWMAQNYQSHVTAVSSIGKWKTGLQITALIMMLLFNVAVYPVLFYLGLIILYGSVILALWSMFDYFNQSKDSLKNNI